MTKDFLLVPFLGVNDDECHLLDWYIKKGEFVQNGDTVCTVETTKTAIDVVADSAGYIYPLVNKQECLLTGEKVALIVSEAIDDDAIQKIVSNDKQEEKIDKEPVMTKKAELLIKKNQLDLDTIKQLLGNQKKIKEEDILNYLDTQTSSAYRKGFCHLERIGIIGGVGGGGALIIIDSLLQSSKQQAVCIFDQNHVYHGKNILGVPIVGNIELLTEYFNDDKLDAVVIAFNRNLQEREELFIKLKAKNIPFTNIIDRYANIRGEVTMGVGNIILGNTYIGACSQIKDNNFISSNVCLEHGNTLGSHCGFGPGVVTSGNVTIGDRVRFATGIFIEPEISIGNDTIISSGAILRSNIPNSTIVRVKYAQEIKPK